MLLWGPREGERREHEPQILFSAQIPLALCRGKHREAHFRLGRQTRHPCTALFEKPLHTSREGGVERGGREGGRGGGKPQSSQSKAAPFVSAVTPMMGSHLPMNDLSSLSPTHALQAQMPLVPSSHCTPPPPYPMDSSIARYLSKPQRTHCIHNSRTKTHKAWRESPSPFVSDVFYL